MLALVLGTLLFGLLSLAVLLATLWFAYTYMLWRMGWRVFAARYGTDLVPARSFVATSLTLGHVFATYKTTARVGFVPEGVHFAAALPLGVAHAPFLLPWERVGAVGTERGNYGERIRLELRDEAGRVLVLLPAAALAALEAQRAFQR
jgi:hypothetical protein